MVDVAEFVGMLRRIVDGDTVVDPEVVRQLLRRRRDPLARLSVREREVLGLIAEGRSNASIARTLVVSEAAVGKHVGNILGKLDLPRPRTPTVGSWRCWRTWAAIPICRWIEPFRSRLRTTRMGHGYGSKEGR